MRFAACDLHLAMSLVAKFQKFGIKPPLNSLVIQPEAILQRRQKHVRKTEVSLSLISNLISNFDKQ